MTRGARVGLVSSHTDGMSWTGPGSFRVGTRVIVTIFRVRTAASDTFVSLPVQPPHSSSLLSGVELPVSRIGPNVYLVRDQSESMSGEEESIEQAAAARRERLRALKAAQDLLNTPDDDSSAPVHNKTDESETNDEENNLNMKFRNYLPHDKQLQGGKLAPPVLPKFEDPVATLPVPEESKEDPFVNIAPKKPNWDLRRDVQKKLDKLERRTQKAIFQLMEQQEKEKQLAEGDERNSD